MIEVPEYFAQAVIGDNGIDHEELIVIEELSELQKEIVKHFRGKGDLWSLVDEMADVYICLKNLQVGLFVSDHELNEHIMNKTERYYARREKGDTK